MVCSIEAVAEAVIWRDHASQYTNHIKARRPTCHLRAETEDVVPFTSSHSYATTRTIQPGTINCNVAQFSTTISCAMIDELTILKLHQHDHAAFMTFRSTCKTGRAHSEELMFRYLSLTDDEDDRVERELLSRFCVQGGYLAACIRTLELKADQSELCQLASTVNNVGDQLSSLATIMYDAEALCKLPLTT
jgi:hypothetical protein